MLGKTIILFKHQKREVGEGSSASNFRIILHLLRYLYVSVRYIEKVSSSQLVLVSKQLQQRDTNSRKTACFWSNKILPNIFLMCHFFIPETADLSEFLLEGYSSLLLKLFKQSSSWNKTYLKLNIAFDKSSHRIDQQRG